MKNFIFSILCILFLANCSIAQVIILCDKESGANYLRHDEMDGFYNLVNPLEIAIQLKNDSLDLTDRAIAIKKYRASYDDEVISPNEEESQQLAVLLKKLITSINQLNAELLPDTVRIIMVKGNHYGASTFFTRGNAIITSRGSLANMEAELYEKVMYHELSHIISRYHPKLKDDPYSHLGFERIDKPLMILKDFNDRILYNPDGVAIDHAISLMMEDSTIVPFVPVIYTKADHYDSSNPTFFGYLSFQLIPIDNVGEVYFLRELASIEKLNMGYIMQKYYERITMNTQYIIHPDELLADNFMYLFRSEEENENLDHTLLNKIKTSFTNFTK